MYNFICVFCGLRYSKDLFYCLVDGQFEQELDWYPIIIIFIFSFGEKVNSGRQKTAVIYQPA